MKNFNYFIAVIVSTLLLYSCIDQDYEWDKINKEAHINLGNIPIGNVEDIKIESLLKENLRNQLKFDVNGVAFLEYGGMFEVQMPIVEMPEITPTSIETVEVELLTNPYFIAEGTSFAVIEEKTVIYEMEEPSFSGTGWTLDVENITFTECYVYTQVNFSDFSFEDDGDLKAKVIFTLDLPEGMKVKDNPSRQVVKEIALQELTNGSYSFPTQIATYDYSSTQEIAYSVSILGGSDTQISGNQSKFKFDMKFETEIISPEIVTGNITFNQEISDVIDDVDIFGSAFSENDILDFNDLALKVNLKTNLGTDFYVNIKELKAYNSNETRILSNITGDKGMFFESPTDIYQMKETHYLLGKTNPDELDNFMQVDLNHLFSLKPSYLGYNIKFSNEDVVNKKGSFLFNDLRLESEYTLVAPFSFSRLDINLADTIMDVFTENLAEQLFNGAGEFTVAANEIFVQIGGENAPVETVDFGVEISILDENMNPIAVEVDKAVITNKAQSVPLAVIIHIEESDVEDLLNARHLSFDFNIKSRDGKAVKLCNTDYISIKGLKFKTTTGVQFTIDD